MKRVFVPADLSSGAVAPNAMDYMGRVSTVLQDMGFGEVSYLATAEVSNPTDRRLELDVPDDMSLGWVRALVRHAIRDAGLEIEVGQPLTRG